MIPLNETIENNVHPQSFYETAPIGKLLAKFALPCVISLLVNALYNIVDQIFIGQGVGYIGNSATNVVFPIVVIAMAFIFMISDGCAAYLSLKLGEKNPTAAAKGVGNGLFMLGIVAVVFLVFGLIFLKPLIYLFGCTEAIEPYAIDYATIIVLGLPFMVIGSGMNAIIRADGSPAYAMAAMLAGAVVNTILDPVFIFVLHWGVKGAALATILGQFATFAMSVIYLKKFKSIHISRKTLVPKISVCGTVLAYGISSLITQIAIALVIGVTNNLLKDYGALSQYGSEIPLAAMGIVMKVNQILVSIVVGIAVGAQPIIGYNYGAKNFSRVKKTYLISISIATTVTFIGFLVFQFAPQVVINLFGQEDVLYNEFAQKCFKTFLLACFVIGFQITSSIFFQSIGKPIKSAILSLSRQVLFLIPASIILSKFLGVDGVLWAGPVADSCACMLSATFITFELRHLNKKITDTHTAE